MSPRIPRRLPAAPPPVIAARLLPEADEHWVGLIGKMDEIYAELVRYQHDMEQKNAELDKARHFIASVLASMSDVLVVCDRQLRVQRVNPAFERLSGRSEDSVVGQNLCDLLACHDGGSNDCFHRDILHGPLQDREVCLRSADGQSMPLSLNATPRLDTSGRPDGVVITGRPIGELRRAYKALDLAHHELRQAQQHLIQSEKMASLGRLVAGVAHELNNPISFIYGNVHSLRRYHQRLQTYLNALHGGSEAGHCQHLRGELRIDRLLDDLGPLIDGTLEGAERVSDIVMGLKRFSSGASERPQDCDLADIIEQALHWVVRSEHDHLQVTCKLAGHLPVHGLPGQLQQVIMNLLQNAIDATQNNETPALTIEGHCQDDRVLVDVSDNGPGIGDADLVRLFDPFFTTKPVGKGTGLGLSISYNIVHNHGGCLSAGNRAEGGACFHIDLPLHSGPATTTTPDKTRTACTRRRRRGVKSVDNPEPPA